MIGRQRHSRIEIICIGREILDGRVIDTNSVFLAQTLKGLGLVARSAQRVDDEVSRIVEAFRIAAARSDFVLVTGGLGPTSDDLTAEAAAEFLNEPIEMHPEALEEVAGFFKKLGREMIAGQKKQALLPVSAKILKNSEGSAPGFYCEKSNCRFYFMPGVPKEMMRMFVEQIVPRLPKNKDYRAQQWATQFTSEGELQKRLDAVHKQLPRGFEITYRTRFPENHIGLFANTPTPEQVEQFEQIQRQLTELLGEDVFSAGKELQSLEEIVLQKLIASKTKIITVESCTGGLIYHRLTNIAGSSEAVWGSYGVYSNDLKVELGVDPTLLTQHGAVSREVALALAHSTVKRHAALFKDSRFVCVATTGIAGPSGGTPEKPVGLCYIAMASNFGPESCFEFKGRAHLQRADYKNLFSQKALDMLRRYAG